MSGACLLLTRGDSGPMAGLSLREILRACLRVAQGPAKWLRGEDLMGWMAP